MRTVTHTENVRHYAETTTRDESAIYRLRPQHMRNMPSAIWPTDCLRAAERKAGN